MNAKTMKAITMRSYSRSHEKTLFIGLGGSEKKFLCVSGGSFSALLKQIWIRFYTLFVDRHRWIWDLR